MSVNETIDVRWVHLSVYKEMINRLIGPVGRVFAKGHVILKTLKMVLDITLLNI